MWLNLDLIKIPSLFMLSYYENGLNSNKKNHEKSPSAARSSKFNDSNDSSFRAKNEAKLYEKFKDKYEISSVASLMWPFQLS